MNRRFPSADVGLADLACLLRDFPDKFRPDIGRLLGYGYDDSLIAPSGGQESRRNKDGAGGESVPLPSVKKAEGLFWCVRQNVLLSESASFRAGEPAEPASAALEFPTLECKAPPDYPHLVPWARLWPILKQALSRQFQSKHPDERIIQRRLNRGELLLHIPRKERLLWSSVVLALDDALRHFPLFGEYALIRKGLLADIGQHCLRVCRVASGPEHGVIFQKEHCERPLREVSRDQRVLILSDLGQYGSARMRRDWLEYGRHMRRRGVRPVVLTPVPRLKWDERWESCFTMLGWEELAQESTTSDAVETLLALAAPAVRVEPRLLRTLRRLLPGAGIETELLAWNHPDVRPTYLAFDFVTEKHESWRTRFQNLSDQVLKERAIEIQAQFHAFLPAEVRFEEQLSAQMLLPDRSEPDAALGGFLEWLKGALDTASNAGSKSAIRAWMQRVAARLDNRVRSVPGAEDIGRSLARSFLAEHGDEHVTLPAWIRDREWEAVSGRRAELLNWEIRQSGQRLLVCRAGEDPRGCLLGLLPAKSLMEVRRDGLSSGKQNLETGLYVPLDDGRSISIGSDWARISLSTMFKPKWADAITMRADGLFAEWNGLEASWVLREEPGKYCVRPYGGLESAHAIGRVEYGMWRFPDRSELSWASRIGEDQYGLYAEFDFQGVVQRLRWIVPGTFMMGSPEDEAQRYDDETRHEVTLTHGFWLADTACTQELWQAVMGKNPSGFTGEKELPVDSVNWDDCQKFCKRMNTLVPGLNIRLPAEAQWEYACRAGTTTQFSFGENITTEQVNYNGNDPYNDGPKGEYRERTVAVRDLPCNQWGLYQMHGNVWEWCADWHGEYSRESVSDPDGPGNGEYRVLRGGSWISLGGNVRSAYRNGFHSDGWYRFTGFRFSRGHQG